MDSDDSPTAPLWRGADGRLLVTISVGWLAIRLGREAIPPLLPVIIEEVNISSATAGVGLTVMWFTYSMCQYPGGRLSDGLSRKLVLVASLGTLVVGFAVLSAVTTYAGLIGGFLFVGVGGGLYFAPSRALLADRFQGRRGEVFGIQSAAGSFGAAVAAGVTVVALAVGVWQTAFLPVLVVLAAVLVALVVWHHEAYNLGWTSLELRSTGRRIVALPRIRPLLVAYMLFSFSWQGFLGFLPTLLQAEKGFDQVLSSGAFAMVFVVAIVVGPLAGRLADRFSRVRVSVAGVTVAVVGFLLVILGSSPVPVVAGVLVVAVGLRSYPPVMQAHLMGLFPDDSMGGDFGGIKTVWTGFGSFAPMYVGFVAAGTSYTTAFSGFVLCLLVVIGLLGYVSSTQE